MKKVVQGLTYDDSNIESILVYAKTLEGKTLREALNIPEDMKPKGYKPSKAKGKQGNKGAMGSNIEEFFFGIHNNSEQAPDFHKTQLELKTTGLVYMRNSEMRAKERLAITHINYNTIVNETFENSHLLDKANQILLMAYDYRDDTDNIFDMVFRLAEIWGIPDEDLPQIKKDWETVVQKIREGKAHEISGRDTLYLEAATTGVGHGATVTQPFSQIRAKPRRWMLKSRYMTGVIKQLFAKNNKTYESIAREAGQSELPLEELVYTRFQPYFNKTNEEISKELNVQFHKTAKSAYACTTKAIIKGVLGIDKNSKVAEFEKADVVIRSVRVSKKGHVKESTSFPAINWTDLYYKTWEDSDLYRILQQPFMFVVYQEGENKKYRLTDIVWWQCPEDVYKEAERIYNDAQHKVRLNDYEHFAPIAGLDGNGSRIHVRPHGRNAQDKAPTPQGGFAGKKSFWLTNHYVEDIVLRKNTQ